jgi:hypothetical protein
VINWSQVHARALRYDAFLNQYVTQVQRARWNAAHVQFSLTGEQIRLLAGFVRYMPAVCLAATWCGDCVRQCPILDHIGQASSQIDLRFLDRDANPALRDLLAINGGHRVPVVVFLSEDWFEVVRYGERTLSLYRQMAAEKFGAACPTGFNGSPDEVVCAATAEWLAEFERTQLILRLSPRLRGVHGD